MSVYTLSQLEQEAIGSELVELSTYEQAQKLAVSLLETEEAINEGEHRQALQVQFGIVFIHLAALASQLGTTLEQASADLVDGQYPEFQRFYNAQTPTWQRRHLWLSCLRGAINFSGLMTARYLAAVFRCTEEGARIHASSNPERCMAEALAALPLRQVDRIEWDEEGGVHLVQESVKE